MRRYCRTVLFYRPLPTFSEIKSSFPFSMAIIFLIIRINKYLHYQVKWYQKWPLALHHVNANACITVFWYVITVRSHGRSSSRSSDVSLERNPRWNIAEICDVRSDVALNGSYFSKISSSKPSNLLKRRIPSHFSQLWTISPPSSPLLPSLLSCSLLRFYKELSRTNKAV